MDDVGGVGASATRGGGHFLSSIKNCLYISFCKGCVLRYLPSIRAPSSYH